MKKRVFRQYFLTGFSAIVFMGNLSAEAADKVVVIPLQGKAAAISKEVDPTVDPSVKDGVSWNEVENIPTGFADGVDNDSGGDITGVTAGDGLSGGGTTGDATLNADTSYLQRRVSSTCAAGSSIRVISPTGAVTCEQDDNSGGDITEVAAGTGLTGGGDTGSVTINADATYLQRRVFSSCTAGSSIRAIAEDGTVTCETDSDSGDITGVTAGTGLSGGGSSGAVTVSANMPFILSANIDGGVIRGITSRSGLTNPGYGIYGEASQALGTGVYGFASQSGGVGVKAESNLGNALYAQTNASGTHAGYFRSNVGSGTSGSALYARTYNSTGQGIALWAHNDHTASSDATVVISNDGSGSLLKGFGGDGGNEEFKIDNDGSLHIFDPSIDDDVFHLEAARALLTLGSGSSTIPGDDGDLWIANSSGTNTITLDGASGSIAVLNGSGNHTIIIDPQESSEIPTSGGQITMYDPHGTPSVEIDGDYGGHGNIKIYNNDHILRVNLDGNDGVVAEFYGNVRIRDNAGEPVMELGAGLDYAEGFNVSNSERILSGSVLVIDPDNPGRLKLSETPYDTKVAGIVAGANGIGSGVRLGADLFDKDVALAGRVYCNVDASQAEINTGDLLTTASLPGYAMKADDYSRAQGAILGKAMEPISKGQKGQILVLVTLQ